MAESEADARLVGLSTLLQLEKEARHAADLQRLRFLMVNDTHRLIRYHQAVLWRLREDGVVRLEAVSGLAVIERDAPYVRWLEKLLQARVGKIVECKADIQSLDGKNIGQQFARGWNEWSPGFALFCPLPSPRGELPGGLWLSRDTAWQEQEKLLLSLLFDAYAHAWWALMPSGQSVGSRLLGLLHKRSGRLLLLGLIVAAGFLPIRQSTLAPAEVSPIDSLVVAAPYEGVIESFHVEPNQQVRQGDLLFVLDDTVLRNRLEISRKELAVAQEEYLQASRKAFQDVRTKGEVALLEARTEQSRAEVTYTAELLDRIKVRALRDGVAIFNDVNDWLGRPVGVGEKVLTLADPHHTELDIQLPVADAVSPEPGAEVLMFLDTDPTRPLQAELVRTAYEAKPTPAGVLAFRLKARFATAEVSPRIGLQGTARIYGQEVTLFYYIMRRPLAALRQWFGL